jgi:hypothetical protein
MTIFGHDLALCQSNPQVTEVPPMERIMKYRRQARECRRLARTATNPRMRAGLNEIAETWEILANAREQSLRSRTGRRAARDFRRYAESGPLQFFAGKVAQ